MGNGDGEGGLLMMHGDRGGVGKVGMMNDHGCDDGAETDDEGSVVFSRQQEVGFDGVDGQS